MLRNKEPLGQWRTLFAYMQQEFFYSRIL
jgi:hypothetical protein